MIKLCGLFFFLGLFSSYAQAEKVFERKTFGKYVVTISRNYDAGSSTLAIYQNKQKVFEEAGIDNHYYFGNIFANFDSAKDIYSGHDITQNGVPDLVISNWTGGAHCCNFLYVFELGKSLKKLVEVQAGSSRINLVDLDHDGALEIEFWDGSIDYLFASFAGSPGGRIVLKFNKDQFSVAREFTSHRAPGPKRLKNLICSLKRSFVIAKSEGPDLPFAFLNALMKLSYSGHYDLAMKMADASWPVNQQGLSQFKEEFSEALSKSKYWRALGR